MKTTKEQLLKDIWKLEDANKDWNSNDEIARKNISQFLGSYGKDYYSHQREIKVLRWAEIYYELGKLIERKERLEDITMLRSQVDYLIQKDKEKQK